MISLYIHIPFCIKKCDYCDFLSFPASEELRERYTDALCAELNAYAKRISEPVYTIFFGGGTPSILTPVQLNMIMDTVRTGFWLVPDAEITLECNPGTADAAKLRGFKDAGINRLSIGLQSAIDTELKVLGRIHDYDRFTDTYNDARRAHFDNINIDIMSAIPGQTMDSYRQTLTKIVNVDPEHISSYSLIIEEGTKFADLYGHDNSVTNTQCDMKKKHPLPDEDEEREMYYLTREILIDAGYERYEISNYAKSGRECRHNNVYWTGGEYIGIGIGAASFYGGYRYKNIDDIVRYISIMADKAPDRPDEILHTEVTQIDLRSAMEEYMFLGLRRIAGVTLSGWKERFGTDMADTYGEILDKLALQGLIIKDDDIIRLTDRGIDVSNTVLSNFLLD